MIGIGLPRLQNSTLELLCIDIRRWSRGHELKVIIYSYIHYNICVMYEYYHSYLMVNFILEQLIEFHLVKYITLYK